MENDLNADARIVKTIRRLRSTKHINTANVNKKLIANDKEKIISNLKKSALMENFTNEHYINNNSNLNNIDNEKASSIRVNKHISSSKLEDGDFGNLKFSKKQNFLDSNTGKSTDDTFNINQYNNNNSININNHTNLVNLSKNNNKGINNTLITSSQNILNYHKNKANLIKAKSKESNNRYTIDGSINHNNNYSINNDSNFQKYKNNYANDLNMLNNDNSCYNNCLDKPQTSSTQQEKKVYKPYDYFSYKRKMKNKTDYQKNIMSPNNIMKYKNECVSLISSDKDIIELLNKNGIENKANYEKYIQDNFFSKKYFLTKLEMLIYNEMEESHTLKVFSNNKNRLPLKVQKENFYKNEIKTELLKKSFDEDYKLRIGKLLTNFDDHINKIKNFQM